MNLTFHQLTVAALVAAVVFVIVVVFAQLAKSDDERYAEDRQRAQREETRRERLAHTAEMRALTAYRAGQTADQVSAEQKSAGRLRGILSQRAGDADYVAALRTTCAEREQNFREWQRDFEVLGIIRDPHAREPVPDPEPRLVPLPQAGSVEPTAVLPPGTPLPDEPLPEGEIAGWVAAELLRQCAADAENTFVRNLYTKPLDEIPGLFNRPLALTAGGQG